MSLHIFFGEISISCSTSLLFFSIIVTIILFNVKVSLEISISGFSSFSPFFLFLFFLQYSCTLLGANHLVPLEFGSVVILSVPFKNDSNHRKFFRKCHANLKTTGMPSPIANHICLRLNYFEMYEQ